MNFMKQLGNAIKNETSGRISKAITGLLIAAVIAAAAMVAKTAQIHLVEPIRLYPGSFAIVAVVAGLIGLIAGMKIMDTLIAKAERGASDEAEQHRAEAERKFCEEFKEYPIWVKTMLKAACLKGKVYCRTEDWDCLYSQDREALRFYLSPENISCQRTRLEKNETLNRLFIDHPELFHCVANEDISTRRVVDASKKKVLYGSSREGLFWWWYSDR